MASYAGFNQKLRRAINVKLPHGDVVELPSGAYVKAIKKCYLAKDSPFLETDYEEDIWTAAHSQFGMILVKKEDLEWGF